MGTRAGPRHLRGSAALGALVLVLAGSAAVYGAAEPAASAAGGTGGGSWTTYGYSNARQSAQPESPPLHPLRGRWTSAVLDGGIYGEPLISGGSVYVATENDSVYALSADTGKILWRRSLGTPVPASMLPCGDISPTVGVTSTMVLDSATRRLFASGAIEVGGAVHHLLFALDPSSGRVVFRRDLDRPGWSAPAELQRTGLGLDGGHVLVGFGGNYGDCGSYNGYLMGVPTSGSGATLVFKVKTGREGAIWAPSGVAVDAAGNIYLATGNGSSFSTRDQGDSVVELDSSLREGSYFTPTEWLKDNESDLDLGSSSPMLVPGDRLFVDGKEQVGYLLHAGALGGFGGDLAHASICFSQGGDAYRAGTIYVACPQASLTAVRLVGNSLQIRWRAPSGINGSPTIAGGLIWALGGGRLVGMTFGSGAAAVDVPAPATEHFAAPSAGDGLLVVAGQSDVEAYEGPQGYRPS